MSRKTMLLALAVVSAAAFALPGGASAADLHLTNVTKFSGTFGAGTFSAEEEPVYTCGEAANLNHATGTVSAGGTTGNIELDFTACHTSVFGFTAACHTEGSAANNTIKTSGVFHFITINDKPGLLVTLEPTVMVCASISNTKLAGNIIGTITSPGCGVASTSMSMKFSSSGAVQEHQTYTGVNYHLTSQTGTGTIKEAGVSSETTITSLTAGTLDCT